MIHASNLTAVIELRLHYALTGMQDSLSDFDLLFSTSALKTPKVEIYGGMIE